ncbi:cell surface glycoprotein CD200 receptor 1 isoform X2 [Ailuropoda melanoleuca]|uniref:cell surface glycoprotein CD200 receptor 1 isoform X2 n=1 Tax=Ailuropoda melanoleuca TaxID=9646 RepID=UPI001494AC33|nr:cell surface glycoprotein CD200 receptor 1 isoform X2 [Ailuropoda melanoleuca]
MFNFLCKPSSFGIRSPAKSCSSTPYAICCGKLTHEVLYQAFLSSFSLCVCPGNTSLSVLVDTKVVLACPPASLTNVLIIRWDINLRGKPSCSRAYRRDNNETSERNCTDERISWESRPDLNPALQIGPVAMTHEGYYRCEVAAQEGNFGLGYHLQVSVPPEVTLFRGSNGSIVCRAAAANPAAQISWTPQGDCDTVEQQLGNGAVTIQSTCQWEDSQVSNVSCSVSHVTGNKSLSLDLNQEHEY